MKNSKRRQCPDCEGEHEYLTRECKPVGYSLEVAIRLANMMQGGKKDVIRVPAKDTMLIVLDDSARKLPHNDSDVSPLRHYFNTSRSA